jgi:hypothetical protein
LALPGKAGKTGKSMIPTHGQKMLTMLLYDKTPAKNWQGFCLKVDLTAPAMSAFSPAPGLRGAIFSLDNEQPPKHQSHDRQSGCNAALSFYVQPKVPRIYLDFWDRTGKLAIQ